MHLLSCITKEPFRCGFHKPYRHTEEIRSPFLQDAPHVFHKSHEPRIGTKNPVSCPVSLLELCSSIFIAETGGRMALSSTPVVLFAPLPAIYFSASHRSVFPQLYPRDKSKQNRSRVTLRSVVQTEHSLADSVVLFHTVTMVSSRKQRGEIGVAPKKVPQQSLRGPLSRLLHNVP